MKLIYLLPVLCIMTSFVFAQNSHEQTVKVSIIENAFMCPNLKMKINRTLIQREADMTDWTVAKDFNSATFKTTNSNICNKDSIFKIFVKESEFPFHIFTSIEINGVSVYKNAKN